MPYPALTGFRITANGTVTQTNYGGRTLHSINVSKLGAGGNTLTIYDGSTSDTIIDSIDTTLAMGTIFYGRLLEKGLTCVLATGTAASISVNISRDKA